MKYFKIKDELNELGWKILQSMKAEERYKHKNNFTTKGCSLGILLQYGIGTEKEVTHMLDKLLKAGIVEELK